MVLFSTPKAGKHLRNPAGVRPELLGNGARKVYS